MKRTVIVLSVLAVMGIAILGTYSIQKKSSTVENYQENKHTTQNIMTGKIIKIVDVDEVLIEITKERGNLFLGDIVKVRYKNFLINELNVIDVPQRGDIISIIYKQEQLREEKTQNIQYSASVDEVYKTISDNIVKVKITEIVDATTVMGIVIDEDYDEDSNLMITYAKCEVAGDKSNNYKSNKGEIAIGDEVLIQYSDENISQEEEWIFIKCDRIIKYKE